MGSFMSSALEDNMRKQQEFMLANQLLMLERNINMQNAMRERMMATQVGVTTVKDWSQARHKSHRMATTVTVATN